jgi:hypothetical protein
LNPTPYTPQPTLSILNAKHRSLCFCKRLATRFRRTVYSRSACAPDNSSWKVKQVLLRDNRQLAIDYKQLLLEVCLFLLVSACLL